MLDATELQSIRQAVGAICQRFGADYWRQLDARRDYPSAFVKALTEAGYLSVLIPCEYGGAGLGLRHACAILEEICAAGGQASACHAQMYVMGSLLRHGSEQQKQRYLPRLARGELRLQSFAVTEPNTGTDTTRIQTRAEKRAGGYVINGQKVWISRVQHSDLMLLLARTTPLEQVDKKTNGLSVFMVDLNAALNNGLRVRRIDSMINHHSCELFFDDLWIAADNLVGEEGDGFRVILDSMNAERILIAAECLGDARFFIDNACQYARERKVFGRAIGQNQGVQFPIARSYAETQAAALMVEHAAELFDREQACGAPANMAKMLASEASWKAADRCMQVFGGFAFAREYPIERKFREARLYRTAPVSTNFILAYLAEHVLELPRSF